MNKRVGNTPAKFLFAELRFSFPALYELCSKKKKKKKSLP